MTGLIVPGPALSSEVNDAINTYTLNPQSGSTYTLASADEGKCVVASNALPVFTVPPNASVGITTGAWVDVLYTGTGILTIGPGSGVTLNGCTVVPPKSRVRLVKQATNVWYAQLMPAFPGEILLATASPSGASSVSFDGVFTSAFAQYRLEWELSHSVSTSAVGAQMRLATVDATAANYSYSKVVDNPTTPASSLTTGQTSVVLGDASTNTGWSSVLILNPAAASQTLFKSHNMVGGTSPNQGWYAGTHSLATAYDGLTLAPAVGTFTGPVRIYAINTAF